MPVSTSTHRGFSVPGVTVADTRLGDMQAVKSAIVAIDADIANIDLSTVKKASVGAANGVAQLDANAMIPSSILPSYVDDVVEVANFAALPVTGEAGKIYIAIDSNITYRWGSSTYVEITSSPGSTDEVTEGAVNKYYTDARAADAAPVQSVAGRTGDVELTVSDVDGAVSVMAVGSNNGIAQLDATGKVPSSQLPASVEYVVEYASTAAFPVTGAQGKIYIAKDINKTYRWTGSAYVEVSAGPVSTDFVSEGIVNKYYTDGRASAAAPVQSVSGKAGTVVLTKVDVGLSNVDNTSDANKPVSAATQTALNTKLDTISIGMPYGVASLDNLGKLLVDQMPAYVSESLGTKIDRSELNQPWGVLQLDNLGMVPSYKLPSYVDDVVEFADLATLQFNNNGNGETGKIYVTIDTGRTYRFSGTTYVEISPSPGSTADIVESPANLYFTNERAAAAAPVQSVNGQVGAVVVNKTSVGLSNVDNTSDAAKNAATVTLTNKTLVSPALTGSPTAPTAAAGDNSTLVATTAFVTVALGNIGAALDAINGV